METSVVKNQKSKVFKKENSNKSNRKKTITRLSKKKYEEKNKIQLFVGYTTLH